MIEPPIEPPELQCKAIKCRTLVTGGYCDICEQRLSDMAEMEYDSWKDENG